jgi:hypothetical protein
MISTIYPAWEGVKTGITNTSIKSANLKRLYYPALSYNQEFPYKRAKKMKITKTAYKRINVT